jgi:hypothetical protein
VTIDVDIALEVDDALVEQIDLGQPQRQPAQRWTLGGV